MTPVDFEHHFKNSIGVMLNWTQFIASSWPVELRYFALPDDASRIYTPWYARSDGSVCGYNSSSAVPQSVASVALSTALLDHHRVRDTAPPESVAIVPAYRLNDDSILLLDGNHRTVSSQVASSKLAIAAFVINGPIDKQALPDLAHWA